VVEPPGESSLPVIEQLTSGAEPVFPRDPERESAGFPAADPAASPVWNPAHNRRASDAALQNLEFIRGSAPAAPRVADIEPVPEYQQPGSTAPAPSLRAPRTFVPERTAYTPAPSPTLAGAPVWDSLDDEFRNADFGSKVTLVEAIAPTAESDGSAAGVPLPERVWAGGPGQTGIDLDSTHIASPPAGLKTSDSLASFALPDESEAVGHGFGQAAKPASWSEEPLRYRVFSDGIFNEPPGADEECAGTGFSNSLMTSTDYDN
jgi:hypothetical protein